MEQIIRCIGDGCKALLSSFNAQRGRNDEGEFLVQTASLSDLVPPVIQTSPFPEWSLLLMWAIGAGVLLALAALTFFTVEQKSVEIIERFGKFHKVATAGLNMKIPFIDRRADELSLRVQQLLMQIDTKTKDNVFVELAVAIQYAVLEDRALEASYMLDDVEAQIQSYVFDIVRGRVPHILLDAVFEQKDDISEAILTGLNEKMAEYGYKISHAPITEVTPAPQVREAMNQINTNTRLRIAAEEKGEADKVIRVKAAQAKKESDILNGQGIAGQREAMIAGLRKSIEDFQTAVPGITPAEIMRTVMMSQYFDMLKEIPKDGNSRVILVPHSPSGVDDIGRQLQTSMLITEKGSA